MPIPRQGPNRRQVLQAGAAAGVVAALSAAFPVQATAAAPDPAVDMATGDDPVARTYYRVLLRHTRWAETQWDASKGHYTRTDFGFAVVLGNAVLLTRGTYDAGAAGVDAATLRSRTLATITHFAASNRLAGGSEWGRTLFWDTTFQLYFVLAARLMWDDLDERTRANVDTIVRGQADHTTALGTGDDPASGGWTPNGLQGGWVGDTKLEEMGVYAQSLAPGLAWAPDDPGHADWSAAFGRWSRNEAGLPAADRANPAPVDGVPVSDNTAHNIHDTFLAENHGSFGPHYQSELWRTSGRNAAQFIAAGRPLPEVLTAQPNGAPLWRTLLATMSDAGEPLMPMVDDREHLYGRDVIPLAFLAQVTGDSAAARAEQNLADRLEAYQNYPPANRLAKFSGEPKYEPEARAELAISYLLHEWRVLTKGAVEPLTSARMFAEASAATDFGSGPGLLSHQSPTAWAATVSKPGFVKFAWQPGHDDWLFVISGSTPMFLPSVSGKVGKRFARAYSDARDGFQGTASLLTLDNGYAGLATLPSGAVVYATSGTGDGEGHLEIQNLTMPGVAGLDGSRSYTTAEGTVSVEALDAGGSTPPPPGVARVDDLDFDRATVRHIRMLGETPHPTYGYSLFTIEVRDGASGTDLARGRTATASSQDTGREAALVTDGSHTTRWAVARAERGRADSWISVDLGQSTPIDRVRLYWETAAGRSYRVQGSDDGQSWTDLARYPVRHVNSRGGWLAVDGRAGLVVRGSTNPITVAQDTITLSDGPATGSRGMVVEGYTGADPARLRALAERPAPDTGAATVRAARADDHLCLFNLSAQPADGTVRIPQGTHAVRLYAGAQTVTSEGTDHDYRLEAGAAAVEPARFTLRPGSAGLRRVPVGVTAEVLDGSTVRLSGPPCVLRLTARDGGGNVTVRLRRGSTAVVTVPGARHLPLDDQALGRTTFPTSPLPEGMSDPAAAVDGDADTAWRPGTGGRMVVDLGSEAVVDAVALSWVRGRVPDARLEYSVDGLTYTPLGRLTRRQGSKPRLEAGMAARYIAVAVPEWKTGDAVLARFTVT